jgi:membrane protein implicated in regulation of membrane protease activity
MGWFTALDWFDKVFWVTAMISSGLFLIMLIVTFVTGGSDVDIDADGDGGFDGADGGFHFFTIKNLIAFFTIFGWSGIAALENGLDRPWVILIATFFGLVMMFIMAGMFYLINKLHDSGTLEIKNAIDAIGEVYLTIGGARRTIGKVSVRIQGALRELEALTDDQEDLKTGSVVRVVDVTSNGILIVERLKK